jgi:hypothetical protein
MSTPGLTVHSVVQKLCRLCLGQNRIEVKARQIQNVKWMNRFTLSPRPRSNAPRDCQIANQSHFTQSIGLNSRRRSHLVI